MIAVIFSGILAGAVHVLVGPDHLVAVAPFALNQKKRSWLLGVKWGLGHATGVLSVAFLAWLFRKMVSIEIFSAHCERFVGVMLVGIGLWALRKALRFQIHSHEHSHDDYDHQPTTRDGYSRQPTRDGYSHQHIHFHSGDGHHHTHAAVGVGLLHGLAGGAHFFGVLPALAMPNAWATGIYLISFGLGTICAMAGFSWTFGKIGKWAEGSGLSYYKVALVSCACAAIGVGAYWLTLGDPI